MGWCSATGIFDDILDAVLDYIPKDRQEEVIEKIAIPLWLVDWDCEGDSKYFDKLEPIMRRRFPWQFEDEGDFN